MYCVKCGVRLADTEKTCPLCGTVVYHPDIERAEAAPLYPAGKRPKQANSKAVHGVFILLFVLPAVICFLADLQRNGELNWFGYALGALLFLYTALVLPFWFKKPNPVIFVPCDFAALGVYLWYISWASGGAWFWRFALPTLGALALIVCAMVTLMRYLRRGKFYICGGGFIGFGGFMLLVEFLVDLTFGVPFIGWSVYPLITFAVLGGILIYLGISPAAREVMERKFFF